MDIDGICSYYGAYTRDEYISLHLIPNAHEHQNLSDVEMLWLIEQMNENILDDMLTSYYGKILEINTSTASGEVSVFSEEKSPQEILEDLKKNRNKIIQL